MDVIPQHHPSPFPSHPPTMCNPNRVLPNLDLSMSQGYPLTGIDGLIAGRSSLLISPIYLRSGLKRRGRNQGRGIRVGTGVRVEWMFPTDRKEDLFLLDRGQSCRPEMRFVVFHWSPLVGVHSPVVVEDVPREEEVPRTSTLFRPAVRDGTDERGWTWGL